MRKAFPIGAALAAAVAAGALAGPAAAHDTEFPSTVTINFVDRPGPDLFRGRVESPNPQCVEKRLVRVFRQVADGPDVPIDRDRSEDNGAWDIDVEGDPPPGRYYARALPREIGPAGHSHVCARDRSPVIDVAG